MPAFGTGLVSLQPLGEGGFLEDVAAGRDRGSSLLDRLHRDWTGLFGGLCVFEDGVDDVCGIGACRGLRSVESLESVESVNKYRSFYFSYVDLVIIGDIMQMAVLNPGTFDQNTDFCLFVSAEARPVETIRHRYQGVWEVNWFVYADVSPLPVRHCLKRRKPKVIY